MASSRVSPRQADSPNDPATDQRTPAPKSKIQNNTNLQKAKVSYRRDYAALLVAQDERTDEAIAAEVGVTRDTVSRWKRQPDFAEKVRSASAKFYAVTESVAIGSLAARMQHYQDRHDRMVEVIAQRAKSAGDAPGSDTGLLVKTLKAVGNGPGAYVVEEWAVDTGLLREQRELEKQVSIEFGQWAEKQDITLGGSLVREYVIVTEDGQ